MFVGVLGLIYKFTFMYKKLLLQNVFPLSHQECSHHVGQTCQTQNFVRAANRVIRAKNLSAGHNLERDNIISTPN